MKAWIQFPMKEGSEAELVDTIPAGRILTEMERAKYYAFDPKVKLSATNANRLVFQQDNGSYVIIPDTVNNKQYWHWIK
jgi:hypothetical protein